MTGRTAIFVARDASNNGTTPVGARLALGGLLAGNGTSPLDVRAGVLADAGGALVSGAANMSYNVRAFRAVSLSSTANGPTIGANDATVNVLTTAAPGSNSRIDTIWARQHLVTGDGHSDSDVIYEIGVTQGAVAASPSAPSIPAGAIALYDATVTAAVTATSGLTFTRRHNWTVANGGVIPVFTSGERTAITPYEGLAIWYAVTDQLQVWDGTAWKVIGTGQANPVWKGTLTSAFPIPDTTTTIITGWVENATHSKPGTGHFSYAAGVLTCLKTGLYLITARGRWAPSSAGTRSFSLYIDGVSTVATRSTPAASGAMTGALTDTFHLTAGQQLSVRGTQTSGVSLNIEGDPADHNSAFSVQYLGVAAA